MHGHISFFGMAFGGFHLIFAIVFLYLFYNISKSLQRIAGGMEKKEIKLQLLANDELEQAKDKSEEVKL